MGEDPTKIIVVIAHPWGEVETTLAEWMRVGPGPRPLVRPVRARRADTGQPLADTGQPLADTGQPLADTGQPLPLRGIPVRYRNSTSSRLLIAIGLLTRPWPRA